MVANAGDPKQNTFFTDIIRTVITISNPTPADAGIYVCKASNSQGSSFNATRLVFLGID